MTACSEKVVFYHIHFIVKSTYHRDTKVFKHSVVKLFFKYVIAPKALEAKYPEHNTSCLLHHSSF